MAFTGEDLRRAQAFARGEAGKPYVWGGVGPRGYDCSGFMSVLLNVLENRADIHVRRFGTGTIGDGSGLGLAEGFGGPSDFSLGVMLASRSNDGIGHTAGRLGDLNVECRGDDGVVVGPDARSDTDGLFRHHVHAPVTAASAVPASHPEDDDMQPFSFLIAGTNPVRFASVLPDGTVVDGLEAGAGGVGAFQAVYERRSANARQVDIVQSLVARARGQN